MFSTGVISDRTFVSTSFVRNIETFIPVLSVKYCVLGMTFTVVNVYYSVEMSVYCCSLVVLPSTQIIRPIFQFWKDLWKVHWDFKPNWLFPSSSINITYE